MNNFRPCIPDSVYNDMVAKAPIEEPARQLYFVEILKLQVAEMSKRLGRPLISYIATFGCQMNVTSEI